MPVAAQLFEKVGQEKLNSSRGGGLVIEGAIGSTIYRVLRDVGFFGSFSFRVIPHSLFGMGFRLQ